MSQLTQATAKSNYQATVQHLQSTEVLSVDKIPSKTLDEFFGRAETNATLIAKLKDLYNNEDLLREGFQYLESEGQEQFFEARNKIPLADLERRNPAPTQAKLGAAIRACSKAMSYCMTNCRTSKKRTLAQPLKEALQAEWFEDLAMRASTSALNKIASEAKKFLPTIVSVSKEEWTRMPLQNGGQMLNAPLDRCPCCPHKSLEQNATRNRAILEENTAAMAEWERQVTRALEVNPDTPKNRLPKKPTLKDQIGRCICQFCLCTGPKKSSCPKCIEAQRNGTWKKEGKSCIINEAGDECDLCGCDCAFMVIVS